MTYLYLGMFFQYRREHISNEIDTLLTTPATDEDKKLSSWINVKTSPFLGLTSELATRGFVSWVDSDSLGELLLRFSVPRRGVAWIWVRQFSYFLHQQVSKKTLL